MKTHRCNAQSSACLEHAAAVLRSGGLVAFPTETVYGLGADGLSEEAASRIFEAKGRPQDNPLILHISDILQLEPLVQNVPPVAAKLMDVFWPGPLTLIFQASEIVPKAVTAGLSTVAVRFPSHPVARALIAAADLPVAAPSANRSGRPSPTDAHAVWADMAGRIECLVDGGETEIGLESTVLDVTGEIPRILRPGALTAEDFEVVIGPVAADEALTDAQATPRSPGQKYRHYAPRAPVVVCKDETALRAEATKRRARGECISVLVFGEAAGPDEFSLGSRTDLSQMAHRLFRLLREADTPRTQAILVSAVPETGWGIAIMNRLHKAAAKEELK